MDIIFILLELILVTVGASIIQRNFKIPTPITLLMVVGVVCSFDFINFSITGHTFDKLVLITLPLLIMSDSLKMHFDDLRRNWFSIIWVAVISVILSVGFGVLFKDVIFSQYSIPIAGIVMLFCMISATDPITVSAIFSNFNVPHKLKFLTEGESLFNDATALIIFSLALSTLMGTADLSGGGIVQKSFSVIFGAVVIGLGLGIITFNALKLSDDALVEASILIFGAYSSYALAEHFHFSGILAVIVTMLLANVWIDALLQKDEDEITSQTQKSKMGFIDSVNLLRYAATNRENHGQILKSIDFLSMFASTALFATMAALIDFQELMNHWKEILAVFVVSTIIRGVMMVKFAIVSNSFTMMQSINTRWWAVLTFAGAKGALSILMVHMIPDSFQYKKLFEHVIIGNIFLSVIVYGAILATIILIYKSDFDRECEYES